MEKLNKFEIAAKVLDIEHEVEKDTKGVKDKEVILFVREWRRMVINSLRQL